MGKTGRRHADALACQQLQRAQARSEWMIYSLQLLALAGGLDGGGVLGEAEGIIHEFIAAWQAGAKSGTFVTEKFTVDVTKSPIPRFELLNFDHYLQIGVQFSRGCPHPCNYCGQRGFWARWRHRDPVKFAREIAWLVREWRLYHEVPAELRTGWRPLRRRR